MTEPSFFNVTPSSQFPVAPPSAADVKARMLAQFETVFPRVIQQIYAGATMSRAVKDLPVFPGFTVDYGMFHRWVMKDAGRRAIREEAEEARAEVWADRMVSIAEGDSNDTIDRDKFKNDTYKFLMGRQSKKRYGDTKAMEITHSISIAAALEQSKQRVIEAMVVDDSLDDGDVQMLIEGEVIEESDEDED